MIRTTKQQENKQWFAAKSVGYGVYPVTWQGWVSVFLVIVDIIFSGLSLTFNPTPQGIILSLGQAAIAVILLVALCNVTGPSASKVR